MTITVAASNAAASNTGSVSLILSGTEGNLQVVYLVHRTSSQTPAAPTGDGWSTLVLGETLIETEITNNQARRAIAMWWRVVPALQVATVTLDWQTSTACVGVGLELSTDTAGGTWSFDGTNFNDNGTTDGTSLASNSVTPANNEAVAIDGLCARDQNVTDEDTYDSSFVAGPGSASMNGATQNQVTGTSGYKIVDVTPAAMSTTASWTTSTLATSLIGAWSVSSGGQNLTETLTDDNGLADVAELDQAKSRTDDTGLTDQATAALDIVRDASDDVTVTDTIAVELVTETTDDTGLTDTVSIQLFTALAETVDDTVGITDTVDAQLFRLIAETADDDMAVTDAVAVEQGSAFAADTVLADAVILDLGPAVTDQAGLSDTLIVEMAVVLTDTAGLADTAVGFDPENLARSIVTSQGLHSLTATSDGSFRLTAASAGLHDLIAETEGNL